MFGNIDSKLKENQFKSREGKSKHDIYPWNNYDFDYTTYINNKYSPDKLGFSDKPYLSTLMKDITSIPKYPSILVQKPLLGKEVISGKSDSNNQETITLKKKYDEFKEPYPGFKNEYPEYFPLTGSRSTSYFVKIGTCPVNKIKDKQTCEEKGYTWHADNYDSSSRINEFYDSSTHPLPKGYCYKPRYMFINNDQTSSDSSMNGIVATLLKNLEDLNPMPLIEILMGKEPSNKNVLPLECVENFSNVNIVSNNDYTIIIFIIISVLGIIYLIYQTLEIFW